MLIRPWLPAFAKLSSQFSIPSFPSLCGWKYGTEFLFTAAHSLNGPSASSVTERRKNFIFQSAASVRSAAASTRQRFWRYNSQSGRKQSADTQYKNAGRDGLLRRTDWISWRNPLFYYAADFQLHSVWVSGSLGCELTAFSALQQHSQSPSTGSQPAGCLQGGSCLNRSLYGNGFFCRFCSGFCILSC